MPGFIFYTGTHNYIGFISYHLYPILEKECEGNSIRKNQLDSAHLELNYIWFMNFLCTISIFLMNFAKAKL